MLIPAPRCAHCGSEHLVSSGHAPNGKLRFQCRACKKYGRQNPGSAAYDKKTKAAILAAYHERTSIRGRIGSRGEASCRLLWERVPAGHEAGLLYTDSWSAYAEVLPEAQHRAAGKGAGQTCHIERFNNILRQRLARFVRRTLSFSKTDEMHDNCLRLFLHEYNQPTKHQPERLRLI